MNHVFIDVSRIDWDKLRQQKAHLLEILSDEESSITAEQRISIEGIVTLIDSIQDNAVDEGGLSEATVFGNDFHLDTFEATDQPEVCRECRKPTNFIEKQGYQLHTCSVCGYQYKLTGGSND